MGSNYIILSFGVNHDYIAYHDKKRPYSVIPTIC